MDRALTKSELGRLHAAARSVSKYLHRVVIGVHPYSETRVKIAFKSLSHLSEKGILCRASTKARRGWYVNNISKLCDLYVSTIPEDEKATAREECAPLLEAVEKSKAKFAPSKIVEKALQDESVFKDNHQMRALALFMGAGYSVDKLRRKCPKMFLYEEHEEEVDA